MRLEKSIETIEAQHFAGSKVINEQVVALAMTAQGRGNLILLTIGPLKMNNHNGEFKQRMTDLR